MTTETDHIAALYIGPQKGYLQTGFSFDTICRLGVIEDHPAIMRYMAFKLWLHRAWPTRGTRPAWANRQLSRLSGNASAAKQAQTPSQRVAYADRHSARELAVNKPIREARAMGLPVPAWDGKTPPLPHVRIARGRCAVTGKQKQARPVVRTAMSWRDQVVQDIDAIKAVGHRLPRSLRPTQTWMQPDIETRRKTLQPVPLAIAYHPWLSCTGRKDNQRPCPYCRKHGKHRALRPLTAGPLA